MEIAKNFSVKSLKAAKPGELVKLSWHGPTESAIFILVASIDGANSTGIVLRDTDAPAQPPYFDTLNPDTPCVSYGTEWCLEPIEDGARAPGYFTDEMGALAFLEDRVVLTLGQNEQARGFRSPRYYDLTDQCALTGRPELGYFVNKWRVWSSAAERDRSDATPLFEVTASSPQPR